MHPLLATKGRITLYLLVWAILGGLLGFLLTQIKHIWLMHKVMIYSNTCIKPLVSPEWYN